MPRPVPFEPLEEPADVRARRLAELEDEHMDSLSFDPDFEKWLSHMPAEFLLKAGPYAR